MQGHERFEHEAARGRNGKIFSSRAVLQNKCGVRVDLYYIYTKVLHGLLLCRSLRNALQQINQFNFYIAMSSATSFPY